MAAEVSSVIQVPTGLKDDQSVDDSASMKSNIPMTRDLLGGGCSGGSVESCENESGELDLDSQAPVGWEKRLDLKTGKMYLQKCNFPNSSSSSSNLDPTKLQDLQTGPLTVPKPLLNLFDETSLDLKLVSSSNYQSVCTLDVVRSALERVEKNPIIKRKRSGETHSSPSPSYSSVSSSVKENITKETEEKSSAIAVGCPRCLYYVLVMKNNPKCPMCNTLVPMPTMKKPKIDLNISI